MFATLDLGSVTGKLHSYIILSEMSSAGLRWEQRGKCVFGAEEAQGPKSGGMLGQDPGKV